jgi:hypothetical protein
VAVLTRSGRNRVSMLVPKSSPKSIYPGYSLRTRNGCNSAQCCFENENAMQYDDKRPLKGRAAMVEYVR